MQALKTEVLESYPTLDEDQVLGQLKYITDDEKIYINISNKRDKKVNYLIKTRDKEWINEEYQYIHWNKWWN